MSEVYKEFGSATRLDVEIQTALDASMELHRLTSSRKLSAIGFRAQVTALTGRKVSELKELAKKVASTCVPLAQAVRILAHFVASPQCSNLPTEPGKLLQLWRHQTGGIDGVGFEMQALELTFADVIAIATIVALEQHPDQFGVTDDLNKRANRIRHLKEQLVEAGEKMSRALTHEDLVYVRPAPPAPPEPVQSFNSKLRDLATELNSPGYLRDRWQQEKRRREHEISYQHRKDAAKNHFAVPDAGPYLRCCPAISITTPDWPQRLLEHLMSSDDPLGIEARDRAEAVAARGTGSNSEGRNSMTARKSAIVNVGSGQLISSAFAVGRATDMAVIFPTVTSAAAWFLGGQTLAGDFFRVSSLSPAAGSNALIVTGFQAFDFGKLEFTASQAAVRSLTILTRL